MEDNKKNNAPIKEGGQRISVRPGNFAPPAQAGGAEQSHAPQKEHKGGHHNRNRHNRNRRPKNGDKPQQAAQPQQNAAQQRPATPAPQQQNQQQRQEGAHGRNRRNRNRRGRGDHREQIPQQLQKQPDLSPALQRELDEEFSTPTFSAFSGLTKEKKADTIVVEDTEEFAVDIATASYLTEDIPCGFPIPDGKAVEVVGVRFRQAGRIYFFAPGKLKFAIGDRAIVDTARGPELGDIVMLNRKIAEKNIVQPLRSVLRPATPEDLVHEAENRQKEAEALKVCERKIGIHKLDMRLVDAQYTFDNSKLLFYFTSEGRVDFRELVHDLAGHFHTRIELRQIGIRDESRLIGGLGMCGRPFCCSTFLSDFGQVSVKMAKEQGLSINASKISGCCGRLMCCLRYEHETYVAESKLTPKKDTAVLTPDGKGVVVDSTPLAGTVKVRLDDTPEEAPKTYHRDTLTVLGRAEKHQNEEQRSPKAPAQKD